ncbi:hypothetical protein BCR44DRAFT_1423268 [Catenaria anguillulae PL171]|uniref:C2H2-type domain-containing protein n=1 Tax=Catenaria anguillulae PL171 TaxID=765915 RepID=A0A1Y2I6K0_9FUNG|nr:hypothetical protein BCR44DRAFT_1423268 [Catenaria anguillulae PL171]
MLHPTLFFIHLSCCTLCSLPVPFHLRQLAHLHRCPSISDSVPILSNPKSLPTSPPPHLIDINPYIH